MAILLNPAAGFRDGDHYDEDGIVLFYSGCISSYKDDADGTYASCDPRDEKKEMSTPDDAYAHYDVPPCRKLGDY